VDPVDEALAVVDGQIEEADPHPGVEVFAQGFDRVDPLHLAGQAPFLLVDDEAEGELGADGERLERADEDAQRGDVRDGRVQKGVVVGAIDGPGDVHRYVEALVAATLATIGSGRLCPSRRRRFGGRAALARVVLSRRHLPLVTPPPPGVQHPRPRRSWSGPTKAGRSLRHDDRPELDPVVAMTPGLHRQPLFAHEKAREHVVRARRKAGIEEDRKAVDDDVAR
jgi:hypothetical protein